MADEERNAMERLVAKYDAALADKPHLASIYSEPWRLQTQLKLLSLGRVAYLRNAFGYQAPLLEESGLLPKGWQARLEEGASVLMPKLSKQQRGHLAKRMRDTESASAEEELLLARRFAREFGHNAITVRQTHRAQPEFEVDAGGHRLLVEAKARLVAQSVEQERELRSKAESLLGIKIELSAPLDDKVRQWVLSTVWSACKRKSQSGAGLVLVLSLYTLHLEFDLGKVVRELATRPGNPACPSEGG